MGDAGLDQTVSPDASCIQTNGRAHNNSVFPGKYGQLIEASDKVPPRSNVASNEYAKGENGEGVHRRNRGAFRNCTTACPMNDPWYLIPLFSVAAVKSSLVRSFLSEEGGLDMGFEYFGRWWQAGV